MTAPTTPRPEAAAGSLRNRQVLPGEPTTRALARLDEQLSALNDALRSGDAQALQATTGQLEAALVRAAPDLHPPRTLSGAQRDQVALALGRLAAQREALARANASVDRALGVLIQLPAPPAATYSATGYAERSATTGSAWA